MNNLTPHGVENNTYLNNLKLIFVKKHGFWSVNVTLYSGTFWALPCSFGFVQILSNGQALEGLTDWIPFYIRDARIYIRIDWI
jgi:hypothetical protein